MSPKIFINPGHGRPDPGAVGTSGLTEAEVCFCVGNGAADYLRQAGYEVMVLQSDDLGGVIRKANSWGADLFLSVHCNSFNLASANGTETLYHPTSSKGLKLAQKLQSQLIKEFGLANRGVKPRTDLGVLNQTDMPAVLAEMAFISNPSEEKLLLKEQNRWSKALARGVSDYFA